MQKKIKIKFLVAVAAILCALTGNVVRPIMDTQASGHCPGLRIVFARGSGGVQWEDQNYLAYKNTIEEKIKTTGIDYEFIDLDYPAVAVGFSDSETILTTLGAYVGSGEAYEFGKSVATGVTNLTRLVNNECPETKYVIGGYSQGAMVVSKSLANIKPEKLIYAATFGDPKIYLPEGEGMIPPACRGENLSAYRMYVPDCRAYKGMLGAVIPYEPTALTGKVGTWCNRHDIFCSSKMNMFDHTAYVADDLYEDAAKVINAKITREFGIKNEFRSMHDTAIVMDATGSMGPLSEKYREEALRLAQETFQAGGRVALYDYRDLAEAYHPVERCGFVTCMMESFQAGLDEIVYDGGGDTSESLLSAVLHVMQEQKWKQGATKSIVVLTDADFHSPDLDGTTIDEVVALSKVIDPVNIYVVTTDEFKEAYRELTSRTDGGITTETYGLLTDYIMERADSLPKVEERSASEIAEDLGPSLQVTNIVKNGDTAEISFTTDGDGTLVVMNEALLGQTSETSLVIGGLDATSENIVTLIPTRGELKGEGVVINLGATADGRGGDNSDAMPMEIDFFVPKAPNTGKSRL